MYVGAYPWRKLVLLFVVVIDHLHTLYLYMRICGTSSIHIVMSSHDVIILIILLRVHGGSFPVMSLGDGIQQQKSLSTASYKIFTLTSKMFPEKWGRISVADLLIVVRHPTNTYSAFWPWVNLCSSM